VGRPRRGADFFWQAEGSIVGEQRRRFPLSRGADFCRAKEPISVEQMRRVPSSRGADFRRAEAPIFVEQRRRLRVAGHRPMVEG